LNELHHKGWFASRVPWGRMQSTPRASDSASAGTTKQLTIPDKRTRNSWKRGESKKRESFSLSLRALCFGRVLKAAQKFMWSVYVWARGAQNNHSHRTTSRSAHTIEVRSPANWIVYFLDWKTFREPRLQAASFPCCLLKLKIYLMWTCGYQIRCSVWNVQGNLFCWRWSFFVWKYGHLKFYFVFNTTRYINLVRFLFLAQLMFFKIVKILLSVSE